MGNNQRGTVRVPNVPSRRHRQILTLTSSIAVALGCAGLSPIAADASTVQNVVWWNMWSGSTVPILQHMVQEFNASHPGIHVTELNVPAASGDAKLLSSIAGGDPPDVFTEWNPTVGSFASSGAIQPLTQFETGTYANIQKWMYPQVAAGGVYNGTPYAIPMSMNTWALYYNKSMLKAAGISSPPKTLAQLNSDQAKEWKMSGNRVTQYGFYPISEGWIYFTSYFKVHDAVNGKYDLATDPGARAEMKWMASYDKYNYSAVSALASAFGTVQGGNANPFVMGREGFEVNGVWEAATNIPAVNPPMANDFGVEPFPSVPGGATGPSTWLNGNYNVIPKGAKDPQGGFALIAWLAGYNNPGITKFYPEGGWMPNAPSLATTPAFENWVKQVPYVKLFVNLLTGSDTQASTLTPTEEQYYNSTWTALSALGTHKMTAAQALAYMDTQANK